MTDKLKPMDIYAQMDVPFSIAAFCRQFRLTRAAIDLTAALTGRNAARARVAEAERQLEQSEAAVRAAIAAAQTKMEKTDAN